MEVEKKNNTKQVIAIAGISLVVIIAIIVGAYFFMLGSNKKVFTNALEKTYKEVNNTLNKLNTHDFDDLTSKPFMLETKVSVNSNLEELKILNNYDLGLNLGVDISKNLLTLDAKLNKDNKELLNANLNYINNNLYLEAKQLLNKVILLNSSDMDTPILDYDSFKKLDFNMLNDIDILTKLMKDTLSDFVTEKDITTEKETITIKDTKRNVTTYKITLANNRLEDFNKKLQEKITNSDTLMKDLATLLNVKEDEVKDAILDNPILAENLEIVIYREGLLDNYIGGKIIIDDMELNVINTTDYGEITFADFNITREKDTYTIDLASLDENLNNIIIKEIDDNNYEITLNTNNLKPIKITMQKENKDKINLSLNYEETTIKLELNVKYNVNLDLIDTNNAIHIDELTEDEQTKMTSNLISIFSDFN